MTISTSKEPAKIAGMFDAIARRYDTLNHLLSAGLDKRWRRRAIQALELSGRERVLDMCTGTGDLAIAAVTTASGQAADVVGIDFSAEMLRLAFGKVRAAGLERAVELTAGLLRIEDVADAKRDGRRVEHAVWDGHGGRVAAGKANTRVKSGRPDLT